MIYEHFRVTGTSESVLKISDLFENHSQRRDEVLLSMSEAPKVDTLESMCKTKLRDSEQIDDHTPTVRSRYSTEE